MNRLVSWAMVFTLLMNVFALAFSVQLARATGTIYTRADGSIDPSTAPIQRHGNVQSAFKDNIFGKALGVGGSNTAVASAGNTTDKQPKVLEHRITATELQKLKQEFGVWQANQNYNQLIYGHGTGLRPPTDDEWAAIMSNSFTVENVLADSAIQATSSVDLTTRLWFPPIGNQDGEGSCVAWAVGYYAKTFQEAKEHDWNLTGAKWEGGYAGYPTAEYQGKIVSPDFIYHLINSGVDGGSSFYSAIQLVCFVGASSWGKMPYDPIDHTTWPSEEAWREAPLFRGGSNGYQYIPVDTDAGLANLKNLLVSDQLAIIGVDANKYSSLTSADLWTLDSYVSPSVNHANTVVGYDDTVEYNENGQLRHGAFKIANSWGVGGWEKINDGYYWISYEAMKQRISYCMFYDDLVGYKPELTATFEMSHAKRGECYITVGAGDASNPIVTKSFNQYVYGGDLPFCPNRILFDITEFKDSVPNVNGQSFFMRVYDSGSTTTGTILYFAVDNTVSSVPPVTTVNGDYVYADLTLKETIYIRADGSIEPSTVPIQRDGDLYTFTGDINDYDGGIVVERNNIILNGANHIIGGSEPDFYNGVTLEGRENVTIRNMIITLGFMSTCIYLNSSSNNFILGNDMTSDFRYGDCLILDYSSNNVISGNHMTGISSLSGSNNLISGNNITGTYYGGLGVSGSNNSIIGNNVQDNNNGGLGVSGSDNRIFGNNITNNGMFGLSLSGSNNSIIGNNIADNAYGIELSLCKYNSIVGNNITNSDFGIYLYSSSSNSIYHNNFDNTQQVDSYSSTNLWDNGCEGNYWSDYTGIDSNFDGIGDTPYIIDSNNTDHYPLVNPWTLPIESYLAVRGAHNEIYYRTYNSTSESWENWRAIPEGATCDSPAAVSCSGKLYFVVRGTDGQSLWFGWIDLTDHSFSGWTRLSGASPSAPTLLSHNSKLVLVVRGFTNIVYYRSYDCVQETWTEWIGVPDGATCDSPSVAVLGTSMHLVVRGFSTTDVWGNNTLWHGIVNLADDSFSGWTSLPGATPSAPRLVASEALGELYLTVRGMSDAIWINTWNGVAWEGWNTLPTGATCDSPAVTVVNGELHIVVRCVTGTALWQYCVNLSTGDPSDWMRIDGWTPSAPTLSG